VPSVVLSALARRRVSWLKQEDTNITKNQVSGERKKRRRLAGANTTKTDKARDKLPGIYFSRFLF
jgi:hypothetical protein